LQCWGFGSQGQLGLGSKATWGDEAGEMGTNLPAVHLGGHDALQVVGGDDFTCVLLDDASVVCFGANDAGQVGVGNSSGT
ncbi:unnamed protein product, partial [Sphacelaria rigidula]